MEAEVRGYIGGTDKGWGKGIHQGVSLSSQSHP